MTPRAAAAALTVAGLVAASSAGRPASMQGLEIATSVSMLEGPTVDSESNVYFTDILMQRIMRLSRTGEFSVFRDQSNVANGLVIDPQGRLVAAEGARSPTAERHGMKTGGIPRVTRTDLKTGRMEILADAWDGKPLSGPNDVTIDGRGRLYVTDSTGAAVYRIDGPGQIARILAAPDIERPNGIQISPDDRTLYLVEANGVEKGARMIRAYDLLHDGNVSNMRVLYNFYPGRSADGMSVDVEGNLYAAAGLHATRGTAETLDT